MRDADYSLIAVPFSIYSWGNADSRPENGIPKLRTLRSVGPYGPSAAAAGMCLAVQARFAAMLRRGFIRRLNS